MAIREVDAISDAIDATEREIAGEAWGNEDTDPADATGDRSLEGMGAGLEGQHEPEEDDETEGEDADGETVSEGEDGEGEGEAEGKPAAAAKEGEGQQQPPAGQTRTEPTGRVPPGKLREANERARTAETERDALKAQLEAAQGRVNEIDTLKTQFQTLTQLLQGERRQAPPKAEEPPKPAEVPDIFENPKGFVEHITGLVQQAVAPVRQDVRNTAVATSFQIAHVKHGDTFPRAMEAINRLDPNNPDDRTTVQRIYNSPDPGEALVSWHKRSEAIKRVGDDPNAYEERIRTETRQALLKDPEFRKQLLADLRAEAGEPGPDGNPRTTTRLPRSLNRSAGSNLGAERGDPHQFDDSEQAVADAAWR